MREYAAAERRAGRTFRFGDPVAMAGCRAFHAARSIDHIAGGSGTDVSDRVVRFSEVDEVRSYEPTPWTSQCKYAF